MWCLPASLRRTNNQDYAQDFPTSGGTSGSTSDFAPPSGVEMPGTSGVTGAPDNGAVERTALIDQLEAILLDRGIVVPQDKMSKDIQSSAAPFRPRVYHQSTRR
jgi:hypothetical protein